MTHGDHRRRKLSEFLCILHYLLCILHFRHSFCIFVLHSVLYAMHSALFVLHSVSFVMHSAFSLCSMCRVVLNFSYLGGGNAQCIAVNAECKTAITTKRLTILYFMGCTECRASSKCKIPKCRSNVALIIPGCRVPLPYTGSRLKRTRSPLRHHPRQDRID